MKQVKQKFSLHQPATYQIKVPGYLDPRWSEQEAGMMISAENKDDGPPVTTLTGAVDQAALLGLLRKLYAMGLPLISVEYMDECD